MFVMKAKYNGTCKVTGKQIVAGKTNITKINNKWQVAPETAKLNNKWVVPGIAEAEVYGPESSGVCPIEGTEYPIWKVIAWGQRDGDDLKTWVFRDERKAHDFLDLVYDNNQFLEYLD